MSVWVRTRLAVSAHCILLTVRGEVDGLDADAFVRAADQAKVGCPVGKATNRVEITLGAALED